MRIIPIPNKLVRQRGLKIIEDAAEMIGQTYNEIPCGSFGDISTFSFYPNKHITTGEGGMIVTDDYEKYKWYKEAVLNGMTYAENNWERDISFPGYKMYMNSIQAKILLNNFKLKAPQLRGLFAGLRMS